MKPEIFVVNTIVSGLTSDTRRRSQEKKQMDEDTESGPTYPERHLLDEVSIGGDVHR